MPVLIWTDEAREELREIVAFISERNRPAAVRLNDLVSQATEWLAEHPYLHRVGRVAGTREIVVHPNYIVVYQVLGAEVLVVSILHARQRYP